MLYFRIPETWEIENESMVEVKDGPTTLLLEKFGSFATMAIAEGFPTVTSRASSRP